jgi:hypothetical protein
MTVTMVRAAAVIIATGSRVRPKGDRPQQNGKRSTGESQHLCREFHGIPPVNKNRMIDPQAAALTRSNRQFGRCVTLRALPA